MTHRKSVRTIEVALDRSASRRAEVHRLLHQMVVGDEEGAAVQWGTQGMKAVLQHRRQFSLGVPVGLLCWGSGSRKSKTWLSRPRREIDRTTAYFADKPTDTHTDDRERPYLADERLQRLLLELAGAAEVGLCVGYGGFFRDGSRPSRPPHGHARCSRRGRTRLRGREKPPAQLQVGARISNLRVAGGFSENLGGFRLPEATRHSVRKCASAPPASLRTLESQI